MIFDRRLLCTCLALALTGVLSYAVWRLPAQPVAQPPMLLESVSGFADWPPPQPSSAPAIIPADAEPTYSYILREYEGRIAVFVPDTPEPQIIFDVFVKFLPDYDRMQMKQGIPVADYTTLSAIIEDYIS